MGRSKQVAEIASEKEVDKALAREREEVEIPDAWKPLQAGEKIVGVFVEAREIECTDKQGKKRTPTVFFLIGQDGKRVSVWGSANLQPQMERKLAAGIESGQCVAVSYDGEAKTSSGFKVKKYVLVVFPK